MLNSWLFAPNDGGEDGGGGGGGGAAASAPITPVSEDASQNFYHITPDGAKPGKAADGAGAGEGGEGEGAEDFAGEGGEGGEGEAEGGEGEGEGREDFGAKGGEGEGVEGEGGDGQPPVKKTVKAQPQLLRLDPESLNALREGLAPRETERGEPQLTPDQIKKIFNPVEVTPESFAKLRSEDPKVAMAGYQELLNAAVVNATSIAKVMIQKKTKEFEAAMGPIAAQAEQQTATQRKEAFYKEFPVLSKYPKIVKLAAMEVSPTHADGREKTAQEVYREVASLAQKELGQLGVKVELTKQSRPANHGAGGGNGGVPQPNRFSTPGRSGGDLQKKPAKPNAADADIYVRRS